MISKAKKKAAVEKILLSSEFRDAPTYKNLLLYLTEYSLTGESPKESTIAAEFFKNKNINTERDAKVRVYMHNLRKKLDSYYLNEGKDDDIKIIIPKGHYLLNFKEKELVGRKIRTWQLLLANFIIIGLVILANLIYWSHKNKNNIIPDENVITQDPIWRDFLASDKPTLLVIGDYFIYQDTLSTYRFFIRNPRINSIEDFQKFLFENPDRNKRYRKTELTFLGKFAVWCLDDIVRFFILANRDIKLQLASHLQWEDFRNNNIIFIGSFKTLRIMKDYIKKTNFKYRVYPNTLYYYDSEADSTFAYHAPRENQTGYVTDYALVTKFPGPNGNVIMTFSSTHDIGHISVVNAFTDISFLREFEAQHFPQDKNLKFFEAVFEVTGFERTGFKSTMLHFNRIAIDEE